MASQKGGPDSDSEYRRIIRLLEQASNDERDKVVEQVALRAAAGDFEAAGCLASIIRRHGLARRTLRQYLFTDHDVDVAEGAVLIAVAYRIRSFRKDSRFSTWLHTVAKNEAKQLLRSEARHRNRASNHPIEDEAEHFVEYVSSMVVDRAVVKREIAQLGDQHREGLFLREELGLTYEEIALRLEIPVSTAKSRVRRARLALVDRLNDQLPDSNFGA